MRRPDPAPSYLAAFALLLALVMLWGVGHRFYETLMPQFAAVFALSGARRALADSAYQIVYAAGAIPAALIARTLGYKTALLIGLGCVCMGAFTFYPAAETRGFFYFLFATMLMAYGWVLLEVSANPLVMAFGQEDTAVRRLNLAQAVYPVGSLIGIFTARWLLDADLALPEKGFSYSIAHPYIVLGLGVLVLTFLIEEMRFPSAATIRNHSLKSACGELGNVFGRPLFGFAIVAQGAGILSLALSWGVAGRGFPAAFPQLSGNEIANVFVWCVATFGLGRFVATGLMWLLSPERVLELFAAGGAITALAGAVFGSPAAAFASVVLCFFLGPVWPTVFALGVNSLGERMKLAAAPLIMGGALGAVAARLLSDIPGRSAMGLAAAACTAILAYAAMAAQRSQTAPVSLHAPR